MFNKAVYEYKKRREKRLAARGYRTKLNEYRKTANGAKVEEEGKDVVAAESADAGVRMDAPDKNQQNEPDGGGSGGGGGHGNTRLPFGLCKRFGIEIEKGWGPSDAWAALAGKGITPAGAYTRLKQGKDPAKPIRGGESPKPKEPKKTFTSHGKEYSDLKGKYLRWSTDPYKLEATGEDGRFYRAFQTKSDLMQFLKEKGVEEFSDPETGEVVNPVEMELPRAVMGVGIYPQRYFSGVTIGLRKGRYAVIGTGLEGKKETLRDFRSLSQAEKYLEEYGVAKEDVKISPSVKKREKERVAWKDSDKKEYIDYEGKKYGDLSLTKDRYGEYIIKGSTEDGEPFYKECGYSEVKVMKYLKEQGVERIKYMDDHVNPMEFEVPETVATISGEDYSEIGVRMGHSRGWRIYGKDLDGDVSVIASQFHGESYDQFIERACKDYDIPKDKLTISEETQKEIDRDREEAKLRAERRAAFEEKAIDVGGTKYVDVQVVHGPYDPDEYQIIGYDEDGDKRRITYTDSLYGLSERIQAYGLNPDEVIKDSKIRKQYDDYLNYKKDFDSRAVEYGDGRYIDLEIREDRGRYEVVGKDVRGRTRELFHYADFDRIEQEFAKMGTTADGIPMDEGSKKLREKDEKIKKALDSGLYYKRSWEREAYSFLRADKKEDGSYKVSGVDTEGHQKTLEDDLTYDEALEAFDEFGCKDYAIWFGGKKHGRPPEGMREAVLMRTSDGFKIMATTDTGETKDMHSCSTEKEAREWLRDNGVDDESVKTRGMNPNDDAPRTHTQKSLSSFDAYRMKKIDGTFIDKMSSQEKNDAVEMLTEVFTQGAYRVARSTDSFGGIIENGYKSQVETGSGGYGAAHNKDLRKDASKKFFGHSGLEDSEYEKCGYLGLVDDAEDWDDSGHPVYGGNSPLTYTLKKENMKDRTTYTYGDSLNTRRSMSSAGYAGDKPTIEGLTSLNSKSYVDKAITAFKEYKEGKISYQEMFRKIRRSANNNYIELQFHGPVTVQDIEKVTFNKEADLERAFSKMSEKRRKKVIGLLQSNGVKLEYRQGKGTTFQDAWEWIRKKYPADFEA